MFGAWPACFALAPSAPPRGRAPTRGTAATVARVRRSWRRPRRRPRNKDCAAQFGRRQAAILPARAALVSPRLVPPAARGFVADYALTRELSRVNEAARINRRTSRPSSAAAIRLRPAYTLSPQDGPAPGAIVGHSAGISEREAGWTPGRCGKTAIMATIAAARIAVAV